MSSLPTRTANSSFNRKMTYSTRARSGLLQAMLVFMCVASTALYVNMDKRMNSLTYQMQASKDMQHEAPPLEGRRSLSANQQLNMTSSALETTSPPSEDETPAQPEFAYMFLIGGIDPAKPGYRGFLYNVMIACDLLKRHGSKADFLLFLQMSPDSPAETLPDDETESLRKLGIQAKYMEKPETASFTDINMEKFRLLSLTQYKRVLFLDADILPLVNMDYLMELSLGERPLIQPNFVVATLGEPANGGCFMLEPKEGAYEALLQVVENQRESAKDLGYPFFDRRNGWGHSFKDAGDEWKGTRKAGSMWRWHGAHVDQGLLFYWTKYHQQAVTIFRGEIVENWVAGGEKHKNQPFLEASMDPSLINKYAPKDRFAYQWNCDKSDKSDGMGGYLCKTPYYNYAHFTGSKKPWQQGYNANKMKQKGNNMLNGPYRAWFETLFDLSKRMEWDITPDNVDGKFKAESPFGYMPNYADFAKRQQGDNFKTREEEEAEKAKTAEAAAKEATDPAEPKKEEEVKKEELKKEEEPKKDEPKKEEPPKEEPKKEEPKKEEEQPAVAKTEDKAEAPPEEKQEEGKTEEVKIMEPKKEEAKKDEEKPASAKTE